MHTTATGNLFPASIFAGVHTFTVRPENHEFSIVHNSTTSIVWFIQSSLGVEFWATWKIISRRGAIVGSVKLDGRLDGNFWSCCGHDGPKLSAENEP